MGPKVRRTPPGDTRVRPTLTAYKFVAVLHLQQRPQQEMQYLNLLKSLTMILCVALLQRIPILFLLLLMKLRT